MPRPVPFLPIVHANLLQVLLLQCPLIGLLSGDSLEDKITALSFTLRITSHTFPRLQRCSDTATETLARAKQKGLPPSDFCPGSRSEELGTKES